MPQDPQALQARQLIRAWNKRARARAFILWLKESPCLDCGGHFHPDAMEFDHRGRKVKSIHAAVRCSFAALVREVLKCDLVCANCHRIRTAKRRKN